MLYLGLLLTDPNHCIDSTDMSPPDPNSTSLWKKKNNAIHQREEYFVYIEYNI